MELFGRSLTNSIHSSMSLLLWAFRQNRWWSTGCVWQNISGLLMFVDTSGPTAHDCKECS